MLSEHKLQGLPQGYTLTGRQTAYSLESSKGVEEPGKQCIADASVWTRYFSDGGLEAEGPRHARRRGHFRGVRCDGDPTERWKPR